MDTFYKHYENFTNDLVKPTVFYTGLGTRSLVPQYVACR